MNKFSFTKVIFFLILLSSCGSNDPLQVDVSAINVPSVKIKRFDSDLFALKNGDLQANTKMMLSKYGDFYEGFLSNIICKQGSKDTAYPTEIARFLADENINAVYADCKTKYTDLSDIEEKLHAVFQHYKYYFLSNKLPVPVAAFTGFHDNISVADSVIAFSLEGYLGSDSKFYDMGQVAIYLRKNMTRNNIVPDFIKGWVMNGFPNTSSKEDLLSEMIYQGKIVYMIDALMPDAADSLKIGFTQKQFDWCVRNESNMWGFLMKNQLLYSSKAMDIAQFTNDGPFTTGFVKESPARTGVWIGWQIIKSYMKKNPKISLKELMNMNDAQQLLDRSKYKP